MYIGRKWGATGRIAYTRFGIIINSEDVNIYIYISILIEKWGGGAAGIQHPRRNRWWVSYRERERRKGVNNQKQSEGLGVV